jgi:hypothetical protein
MILLDLLADGVAVKTLVGDDGCGINPLARLLMDGGKVLMMRIFCINMLA